MLLLHVVVIFVVVVFVVVVVVFVVSEYEHRKWCAGRAGSGRDGNCKIIQILLVFYL